MNSKIALGVVVILLILGIAFVMGRGDESTTLSETRDTNSATVITQTDSTATSTGTTTADSRFSAEQRQLLMALGIDPDEIVITAEMEACAETKLGASRMAEIRNGATTSVTEGMELATCFE